MNAHCFGETVKKLLVERDLTQKKLAECIEIDPVTLNRYIKGERRIPEPTLRKVAEFFNVEPQQLVGSDESDMARRLVADIEKSLTRTIVRKYGTTQVLAAASTGANMRDENRMIPYCEQKGDETEPQNRPFSLARVNLVPPESLFSGASTEEKKELLELYFSGLKKIVEIACR